MTIDDLRTVGAQMFDQADRHDSLADGAPHGLMLLHRDLAAKLRAAAMAYAKLVEGMRP